MTPIIIYLGRFTPSRSIACKTGRVSLTPLSNLKSTLVQESRRAGEQEDEKKEGTPSSKQKPPTSNGDMSDRGRSSHPVVDVGYGGDISGRGWMGEGGGVVVVLWIPLAPLYHHHHHHCHHYQQEYCKAPPHPLEVGTGCPRCLSLLGP